MTSPNGITWTTRSNAVDNDWTSICWSSELGLFCTVSNTGSGDRVMTTKKIKNKSLNGISNQSGDFQLYLTGPFDTTITVYYSIIGNLVHLYCNEVADTATTTGYFLGSLENDFIPTTNKVIPTNVLIGGNGYAIGTFRVTTTGRMEIYASLGGNYDPPSSFDSGEFVGFIMNVTYMI
jgi:hypothetical protein